MSKLSKKQAQAIASKINSLQVSESMRNKKRAEGNSAEAKIWWKAECKITVELADEFGIELPGLHVMRNYLSR